MQQLCIRFLMGLESIISYANSSVYLVDDVGISWESVEDLPQRSDVKEPVERGYMCLKKGYVILKKREGVCRKSNRKLSINYEDQWWAKNSGTSAATHTKLNCFLRDAAQVWGWFAKVPSHTQKHTVQRCEHPFHPFYIISPRDQ